MKRWKKYISCLPSSEKTIEFLGYDPGKTTRKQIPAGIRLYSEILRKFNVSESKIINIDYGGGKYNLGKRELRKIGVRSYIYDIYNRTQIHNSKVRKMFSVNKANTATLLNVLNVVDFQTRIEILKDVWNMLADGGILIIQTYNSKKKGITTSKTYQESCDIKQYEREVDIALSRKPDAYYKKIMIIRK